MILHALYVLFQLTTMESFSMDSGRINLIACVKNSCDYVVKNAEHVKIDDDRIFSLISEENGVFSEHLQMLLDKKNEWDAAGWHYNDDLHEGGELTAQYIMMVDTLNFCFWPCEGLEYEHLAIGLKNVLKKDKTAFDALNLVKATEDTLREWVPDFPLPQLSERVDRVREVGYGLLAEYDGKVSNLIRSANHSAPLLVDLITRSFPGFRDTSLYKGRLVHFYKRAQIFVADLWGAFQRPVSKSSLGYFSDIEEVTMFADYRVPQILLSLDILEYTPDLTQHIRNKHPILYGSEEEVEIRAATVMAVERMRRRVQSERGVKLTSIEMDWVLWNWGERVKEEILPHHRTLTIYY